MDFRLHNTTLHDAIVLRNIFLILLVLSLLVNAGQAWNAATEDKVTRLVPSVIPDGMTIGTKSVDRATLELLTRDMAGLLLNGTPATTDYARQAILRITHPAVYGAVEQQTLEYFGYLRDRKLSTVYFPTSVNVDTRTMMVEMVGQFDTYMGKTQTNSEVKIYQFKWAFSGGRLSFYGFQEVSKDHAGGKQ